jgi:DNA-binding response OmpR family regulator
MKVLAVDDDVYQLDLLTYALRREGYTVLTAVDGEQALRACEAEDPELVLLDVNLPKLTGFEVCRQIRRTSEVPIIMLTARHDEEDILRGLQLGVDDYVTKPFSAKQLITRMKTVLRRCRNDPYQEPVTELTVGDLRMDLQSYEVTKAGQPVQLTPLEFRILYLLAINAGRVIPYARLMEYTWGYYGEHNAGNSSMIKTHIYQIRQKLNLHSDQKGGIKAVRGVGYSLARD